MVDRPSRRRPAPEPGEVEDPLAADKRTLLIGAVAMVLFVAVGVVTAQVFVTGGCASFGDVADASAQPVAVDEVLDADVLAQLEAGFATDFDRALRVPGDVDGVTLLPDGALVTGDTLTAIDAPLDPRSQLDVPGTIVGEGTTVFDVALANELTGQVDAFTPVAGSPLEPGDCTDTAVVSEQFAFLLDAGDGQLLQLRIDEDGEEPTVELRDRQGPISAVEVTLPAGPAGVLGERVTGAIGEDVVVVARRAGADGAEAAVIVAEADTGRRRAEVSAAELRAAVVSHLDGAGAAVPLRVDALLADDGHAVLAVRPDPADDDDVEPAPRTAIVMLDLDDGSLTTRTVSPGRALAAIAGPRGALAVAFAPHEDAADGPSETAVSVTTPAGESTASAEAIVPGTLRHLRWDEGPLVVVTSKGYAVVDADGGDEVAPVVGSATDVRDVRQVDGRTLVLVRTDQGGLLLAG